MLYLSNNKTQYPGFLSSIDEQQGRIWMGKKGNSEPMWDINVTERPLNVYMGYTRDNIETPGVKCPFNNYALDAYNKVGSTYAGNAYSDWDGLKSKRISQVKSPSTAALATEHGAYAVLTNQISNYWRMTHDPKKLLYPVVRVDGSSILHLLAPGEGITTPSKTVNFNLSLEP